MVVFRQEPEQVSVLVHGLQGGGRHQVVQLGEEGLGTLLHRDKPICLTLFRQLLNMGSNRVASFLSL